MNKILLIILLLLPNISLADDGFRAVSQFRLEYTKSFGDNRIIPALGVRVESFGLTDHNFYFTPRIRYAIGNWNLGPEARIPYKVKDFKLLMIGELFIK